MLHKNSKNTSQMQIISIEQIVPQDHFLRKVDKYINFDFIYGEVEELYCLDNGRPSIDPVVLVKILLIQCFYGIKSMRQTIKDIQVNTAYRWFLGYDLTDEIPHFTTYSKNYTRRFKGTNIFENIFSKVLMQAIEEGLVDSKMQFVDSTHVKAHANRHKNHKQEVVKKAKAYQRQLEKEINLDRKHRDKKELKVQEKQETKQETISDTDPESGLFHKGEHKEVFAYSVQTSCDKNGWILNYKAYPGNLHDSTTFFDFYQSKVKQTNPEKLVMDAGYKTPAIAKMLIEDKIMPVLPYTRPKGQNKNGQMYPKREYVYDEYEDYYICPENKGLEYSTTDKDGYRHYKSNKKECLKCKKLRNCTTNKQNQKTITRHIWQDYIDICEEYRYTYTGKAEYEMRKQTIERQFGTAKECHNFRYTNQRGIEKMTVKAAITFTCLNIKKLVKMLSQRDTNSPKKLIQSLKNIYTPKKIQFLFKIKIQIKKLNPQKYFFVGLSSACIISKK